MKRDMSKFGRNIDICMNLPPVDKSWHGKCKDKGRQPRYVDFSGRFRHVKRAGGRCGQKPILRNVLIITMLVSVGKELRGFWPPSPFWSSYYSRPYFFGAFSPLVISYSKGALLKKKKKKKKKNKKKKKKNTKN